MPIQSIVASTTAARRSGSIPNFGITGSYKQPMDASGFFIDPSIKKRRLGDFSLVPQETNG